MVTMVRMKETKPTLGSEVQRLRKLTGQSQEWLAERLGVTREAVSAIERGKTKHPRDEILTGLENHLGLSRQRSLELIAQSPISDEDLRATIIQIGAMKEPGDRLRALRQFPQEIQQVMMTLMSDLAHEVGTRLGGKIEP